MSRVTISLGILAAVVAANPITSAPAAGQTLANGEYVCNPAHSYPGGASCDGSGPTPTLIYASTTAGPKPGDTLSDGTYVCNPAHSYPAGASCDGSGPTPTLVYASTTAGPRPGETLSNGAYVCNPAHSYPAGASCDGSGPTPTLVYPSTTAPPSAGQTLSNGAYVCNPAHSYPGAICNGTPPTLSYYPTANGCVAAKTTLATSTIVMKPTGAVKAQSTDATCPLTLAGTDFQFPHLIVTSNDGKKTSNTLYNGTASSSITSYFNFDLPSTYAGKTCDVVFSLPRQDQLQTSSFHLTGNGALIFNSLHAAAAENADIPQSSSRLGSWTPIPGESFAVSSGACAFSQRIGYSIGAEGDRWLDYFQDYNPCPIGLYIVAR